MNDNQYCTWESLQALRRYWIAQGHQNTPDPNCSCGFLGTGQPDTCEACGTKEMTPMTDNKAGARLLLQAINGYCFTKNDLVRELRTHRLQTVMLWVASVLFGEALWDDAKNHFASSIQGWGVLCLLALAILQVFNFLSSRKWLKEAEEESSKAFALLNDAKIFLYR